MFDFGIDFEVSGDGYATSSGTITVSSDVTKYKYDDGGAKKSGFTVNMMVLGLGIAGALLLLFIMWLMCHYGKKWNEECRQLRRVISRMESGENVLIEDRDEPVVDHPIWYIRTQGLQQSVIDSISIMKFKKGKGLVEGTDCSICLSEFEEDESLRMLRKCNHAFHVYCIDKWLESHKNCPLCRMAIAHEVVGGRAVRLEHERLNFESGVDSEGQGLDETESSDHSSASDEDLVPSVDGKNGLILNKDLLPSRGSNAKSESNLVESCRAMALRNEEQPMRRSVSTDPTTAAKIHGAVANIKVSFEELASGSSGG